MFLTISFYGYFLILIFSLVLIHVMVLDTYFCLQEDHADEKHEGDKLCSYLEGEFVGAQGMETTELVSEEEEFYADS